MKNFSFIFILLIFTPITSLAITRAGRIKVTPDLEQKLSHLVQKASDFHDAFQKKQPQAIQNEIKQTQIIIKDLYGQLYKIPQIQQRIHTHKVLSSLRSQLEIMKFADTTYKSQKSKHIKKLFSSFFEITHVYDLKNKTKNRVFYCRKDKSIWFQSKKDPKNPVNPNLKNCGRQIW